MTRTLPWGMGYRECRILVEAAMAYHPKLAGGEAVVKIWTMPQELYRQVKPLDGYEEITGAILSFQDRQ